MRGVWVVTITLIFMSPLWAQITVFPQSLGNNVNGPSALYGVWGTHEQCVTHRSGAENTRQSPFEIDKQWIKNGFMYCLVRWTDHTSNTDSAHARAYVQCGEDQPMDYHVTFNLNHHRLEMRWSKDFKTPLLKRC